MSYPSCVKTSENDKTITFNTIYCNNDKLQYCKINDQRNGECVKINQFYDPKKLYPGDPCDEYDYTTVCAYGTQKCVNSTCESVGFNGSCSRTFDCDAGQYCEVGKCRNYKKLYQECFHKYECGRVANCLFNNTKSYAGICVPYFSIKVGRKPENRVLNTVGIYMNYDDDTRLLCETGYMDSLGYCSNPPISTNAGNPCDFRDNCTSSDGSQFAKCSCTYNQQIPRYCEILQGNQEWRDEFDMFKIYWNATKEVCNTGARWQECGGKAFEYSQWMCAYYKAYNYIDYLYSSDGNYTSENGLSECLDSYLNDLPEFKNAEKYCQLASQLSGAFGLVYLSFYGLGLLLILGFVV
eukprot:403360065